MKSYGLSVKFRTDWSFPITNGEHKNQERDYRQNRSQDIIDSSNGGRHAEGMQLLGRWVGKTGFILPLMKFWWYTSRRKLIAAVDNIYDWSFIFGSVLFWNQKVPFSNFWISKPNSNTVLDYIENNVFKNLFELTGLCSSSLPLGGIVVNLS
jgi:hypothetical protein